MGVMLRKRFSSARRSVSERKWRACCICTECGASASITEVSRSPAWMPWRSSCSVNIPGGRPSVYQFAATTIIAWRSRRSRVTMSITFICPPWALKNTSLRTPARATLAPMSIHSAISVCADSVTVPGYSECSLLLP